MRVGGRFRALARTWLARAFSTGVTAACAGLARHAGQSKRGGSGAVFIEAQQAGAHCRGNGSLPAMHAQFAAGVLDMEVDGAFGEAENTAGFPACLAD